MWTRALTITLFFPLLAVQFALAQQSPDRLWTATSLDESSRVKAIADTTRFEKNSKQYAWYLPDDYKLFELNQDALTRLSRKAVNEKTARENARAVRDSAISLPMPDGAYLQFQLIESPVMSPALQEKFPRIRSYRGQCLVDPHVSMRLDVAPQGDVLVLHSQILTPEGTIIVDPIGQGNQHMSFVKHRNRRFGGLRHQCLVERSREKDAFARLRRANARFQSGTQLRTYRLAVACTGEYAQFHGGTVAGAMAAINTTVNRVTGLYERDVAIRFELVANNDQLIFTDSTMDPFNNTTASILVNQSQSEIDSKIGNDNYDIGHTFSTGAGGYAPGLVGVTGQKARGVTGQSSPIGDPFDIDYVAHEIGHQLNADHTFNGTGCNPGARFGPTAVEPGSGSTILAYAGICGSDNVQSNSNAYFHSINIEQIINYSSTGTGAVGTTQTSGNSVPIVDAGADFSIPKGTPFKLTATGSDPDNDQLRYCWEQIDTGPPASVSASDDGLIPLFRSFSPKTDGNRVFPKWSDILTGSESTGEQLPSKARTMHFQVTVRDNRSGGGGVASDVSEVDVIESAGPFRVTAPNTSTVSSPVFEVKWNVANSDQSPINCSKVNILLSTDGGQTISQSLVSNTPNDGSELVAVPATANSNLRILVESVDNIFFAVNPVSFAIESADIRVVLVRHGEKASDTSGDPDLTGTGEGRARALANLMEHIGTTHIFSTNTRRTRQTAQPSGIATGISIKEYEDIDNLATKIKSFPSGSNVLIVGHSNTVGPIATALGVADTINIGDEFDNLFVVGLRDGAALFAKWKYQPEPISPSDGLVAGNANQRDLRYGSTTDATGVGGSQNTNSRKRTRNSRINEAEKNVHNRLNAIEQRLERIEKLLRSQASN